MKFITINGETRPLGEWRKHFGITEPTYYKRLRQGMSIIKALTTPVTHPRHYTAFGQTMPLSEWAKQPCCVVSVVCLRKRVESAGMGIEEALTTPLQRPAPSYTPKSPRYTIDGQTYTISGWCKRGLAAVSYGTINERIAKGWNPIDAITTPPQPRPSKPPKQVSKTRQTITVTIGEETKTLHGWCASGKVPAPYYSVLWRIRHGWEPYVALTTPHKPKPRRRGTEPVDYEPDTTPSEAMPLSIRETLGRIAPATVPEIQKHIKGVSPETLKDWERRGWVQQVSSVPVRWALAS